MKLTLDNDQQVFFYEQDFYVLSNFSAFSIKYRGVRFPTSEHAYHWMKFCQPAYNIACEIRDATSAHTAFKIAEAYKEARRDDWDQVKLQVMDEILWAKVEQHEYVMRKLLATGTRDLIENSWRDSFWGWGEDRKGENWLGRLWMDIRRQLRHIDSNRQSATANPK